ncbi:DUF1295-domain-containing protein [Xylariomycetidae sp. FL2044]|nr:DUF1295-domain-containing protein [Xylariomycetidae sp. FL2044]
MAEQDTYKSHLGVDTDKAPKLPSTSGAEQDRWGRWFGGNKADKVEDKIKKNMPQGLGAEQERLGGWLGGDKADTVADKVREHMPQTSGAEQDRFGGWFGGNKADKVQSAVEEHIPKTSGAEQDRLGGWFGGNKLPSRAEIESRLPKTSGAEQDRYAGWFGGDKIPSVEQLNHSLPRSSGAEQDRYGSHFRPSRAGVTTTSTLGLLQDVLLPSFGLHTGLGAIAYGIGRYTNRAEAKDWLWPAGQVANAWWSAVGARVVYDGVSPAVAFAHLTYSEKLLLTGVSAWGLRLFYRIATRSVRRGGDDPRYTAVKKEDGFWNKSFFTMFLPEAAIQTLISLPFTLPFRASFASGAASPAPQYTSITHPLAIFLFAAGYALEILADYQLESHSRTNKTDLNREGVWSIVRHPNYLGDVLCHLSFPLLLYSAGSLHPLALLGPVVNYAFLRYIGGDKQNEEYQESRYAKENPVKHQQLQQYKTEKNSFWPSLNEVNNKWLWIVAAAGAGGAVAETAVRALL